MDKKLQVSYNPQLGYLKTIFRSDFDFLTGVQDYTVKDDCLEIWAHTYKGKNARVVISCMSECAARFRMYPPDTEGAFDNHVFDVEPYMAFHVKEEEDYISFYTQRLEIRIRKYPWEVSYYLDQRLKTREQVRDSNVDNMCKNLPIGFVYDENKKISGVWENMNLFSDEQFYGFGEKFTDFAKRGQTIHIWQTDALSTNTEKSYKSHPFFMSSRGYAILLNTYTRSEFQMGSTSNVAYRMETEDQMLDYMIWMEKDYKSLLKLYIGQTGGIPMIPKWALGLWMSKCSYMSQKEVYDVVDMARERNVKIDVIHIDGWQKEADSGAWVWDYERFPDPEEMVKHLKKYGIRLCLWVFPYIDEHSRYFSYAKEKGYLVKNEDGTVCRFYATAMSKSRCGCFDFTNPEFIAWYKPRIKEVMKLGIGAIKTDFSEAVPQNACFYDGSNGIQGHNKLTFLYAKTVYDAMEEIKLPLGERPMLWCRSGYAGSHTIPGAWAGDSSTHLNNHACILRGGLSLAMSGIPFWGFDMGGFYNTDHEGYECMPTDEEYIRSCQFGFFNSLSRCHGKTPREPWNFGKETEKTFIEFNTLRHLLLPYLYSTALEAHLEFLPMIRPVAMEYPQDRNARMVELEYFLGSSLLVAPVFDQDVLEIYLPKGEWFHWFTGECTKGGQWVTQEKEPDRIPVFIRENTIVPCLEEIPEDIDCPYDNLNIIMAMKDSVEAVYYDDGKVLNFKASLTDGTVNIQTDLPVTRITVYTREKISKATINNKAYTLAKDVKENVYLIN